jgi:uncharacterized cysteine cluster protein YcgN (CxxCxxCC family)
MTDKKWVNPIVKGKCNPFGGCGGGCCKVRVYTDSTNYTMKWCEHFQEETRTCGIYETRPEGCRKYPHVNTFLKERWLIPGCGYRLEEQ